MAESGQTYANHARLFPPFHYFAFPVLFLNLLWSAWQMLRAPSMATAWGVLVAAAILVTLLVSRVMVLAVQDRVIRLEMRLRLREVLPPELHGRISELTRSQLVSLRFASDAELPDLVRLVLSGALKSNKEIKQAVRHWQPDYLRA